MDCLQILHFDRSKGMKKCKTPFKTEPLKVIEAETLDKNFCKKNPDTGVQKQIKCLACRCQIEASSALKSHLKGDKHNKALETYVPRPVQTPKTLKMLTEEYNGFVLGLEKIVEFRVEDPKDEGLLPIYQCQVSDCDGALGEPEDFFKHLASTQHADNYFKEMDWKGHVDQDTRESHSCKDFSKVKLLNDPDQYWTQHNKLKSSSPILASSVEPQKRKLLDDGIENKSETKKPKLETKALKAKRFTEDEQYNETSYYYDANLRKVYPYYFTFTTFSKGRWVGERILDVFAREFRAHPSEEYERCIKSGTLTVNHEKVDIDYKLKHNDLLANVVHRHEVPVTSDEIKIVHIDDNLVVVNKPASIPVHPCGRYRHNTVLYILAKDHGLKNLCTIHRLDRLTSGLLLFGRNPKKAREMEQQIRGRTVQKEYFCRVEGEFPKELVTCKEPIDVVSFKIGVCKVSSNGKDCHTDFQRVSYNGRTSVVLCKPRTGRMHQIRVHLQYLGYPIVNDPLYNHDVFGPEKGKGGRIGKSDEDLIQDLISLHNAENWLGVDQDDLVIGDSTEKVIATHPPAPKLVDSSDSPSSSSLSSDSQVMSQDGNSKVKETVKEETDPDRQNFDPTKLSIDPHCFECKVKYRDPKPNDLVMFLHAWTYSGSGWKYSTELPAWTKEDWVDPENYLT